MTVVTVDLEDLEKLVFATGAIKAIEGTLNTRRNDPFVSPHLEVTEAHNRIAAAIRDARRADAGTLVGYNDPLTDEEINALKRTVTTNILTMTGRAFRSDLFCITTNEKLPDKDKNEIMSVWDRLAAKGCIVIGQLVVGVTWPGADRVSDVVVEPGFWPVKITDRGRERLLHHGKAS